MKREWIVRDQSVELACGKCRGARTGASKDEPCDACKGTGVRTQSVRLEHWTPDRRLV